ARRVRELRQKRDNARRAVVVVELDTRRLERIGRPSDAVRCPLRARVDPLRAAQREIEIRTRRLARSPEHAAHARTEPRDHGSQGRLGQNLPSSDRHHGIVAPLSAFYLTSFESWVFFSPSLR